MMDVPVERGLSRGLADLMRRTHQLDLCKSLEVMIGTTGNHFVRFAQRYASVLTWEQRKKAFGRLATYDVASDYVPDVPGDLDAATANLYGAAVHLYSVEIAILEGAFDLRIDGHRRLAGEDGAVVRTILTAAEMAAKRIIGMERALSEAPFADELGIAGLHFQQAIPDMSYTTEPHWKELGFRRFFRGTARALRRALDTLYIPGTDVSIDAAMFGDWVALRFPGLQTLNSRLIEAEVSLRDRINDDPIATVGERPRSLS